MKNRLHQECSQEIAKKLKNQKRRCKKEENGVTQHKLNKYSMQQDQESRTASLQRDQIRKLQERLEFIQDLTIFQGPHLPSSLGSAHVSHQALITPSSRKPGRESRMQRNTWCDMSIPGNDNQNQSASRVPEELHNDSRNLATSSEIHRREGMEKSVSENHCNQYIYLAFREKQRKKVWTTAIVLSL